MMCAPGTSIPFEGERDAVPHAGADLDDVLPDDVVPDGRVPGDPPPDIDLLAWTVEVGGPGSVAEPQGS